MCFQFGAPKPSSRYFCKQPKFRPPATFDRLNPPDNRLFCVNLAQCAQQQVSSTWWKSIICWHRVRVLEVSVDLHTCSKNSPLNPLSNTTTSSINSKSAKLTHNNLLSDGFSRSNVAGGRNFGCFQK